MESSIWLVVVGHIVLLVLAIIQLRKSLNQPEGLSIFPVVIIFSIAVVALPFIFISIIDAGLESLLYIYISNITTLFFWFGSFVVLVQNQYLEKNKRKFWGRILLITLSLISIPIIWMLVGASGPIKFWG